MQARCFKCNGLGHVSKNCRQKEVKPIKQDTTSDEINIIDRKLEIKIAFQIINSTPASIVTGKRHHRVVVSRIIRFNHWSPSTNTEYCIIENSYKIQVKLVMLQQCPTNITRVTKDNKEIFYKVQVANQHLVTSV